METLTTLLLASGVLAGLAVCMGLVLGWANQAFHVEVDPKVEQLGRALPGSNCGGCGYVGCMEYAEAVARGEAPVTLCAPGGGACAQAIGRIMGIDVEESLPYRAVVHCNADLSQRLKLSDYQGERTCQAANLVSGVQGCTFGCLGFGDCMESCEYDAIDIINGLAKINYNNCVGCKACTKVCPRNIISMVPFKKERVAVVACSNTEKGPIVKEVCSVGCIGCSKCTLKNALFQMKGNLPEVDYEAYPDSEEEVQSYMERCPMESLIYVGKPSARDKALVADQELPERVEADFQTTVDDTEWRG